MASIGDYIFLFIVLAILGSIVYALRGGGGVDKSVSGVHETLKQRGIKMDSSGMSIKTDRRAPTRDEYIDRTRDRFAKSSETVMAHKDAFTTTAWERQKQAEQRQKK
ncbi:unnamed protein product [Parajaminaea phylloscopi]